MASWSAEEFSLPMVSLFRWAMSLRRAHTHTMLICLLIIHFLTDVARGADPKCLEGRQQQIEEDAG